VPRCLTNFFLDMYGSAVKELKANIAAWTEELKDPDTSLERKKELKALIQWAQDELARIEPYLAPLEAYEAKLDEIEDQLKAQFEAQGP
jgi:predicted nuclease with TOPRIM domain